MSDPGIESNNSPLSGEMPYNCPVCGCSVAMQGQQDNIPFFGDILEVSVVCDCGFKFVDTIILGQKEPLQHKKRVCSEGDLCARVIRSTSGTIHIPEWGVDIEPGPASEAYITNVEGIIDRIQAVVKMARKWSETDDERLKADTLLDTMRIARDGNPNFTLVIEDPLGNSAVIGDDVEVRKLSDEEIENLHTGMFIVQK